LRKFNRRQPSTKKITLKPTKIKLKALMNSLPVKGEFQATIANKTKRIVTKFIVMKQNMNSYPLIGRKSLIDLGMLIIDPEGRLGDYREVKNVNKSKEKKYRKIIEQILKKYGQVFEGVGLIQDKRKDKDIVAKLHLKKIQLQWQRNQDQ
jgi:hypothetical protein